MRYPLLSAFSAPARARAEIWRTVLGTVLIAGFYLVVVLGTLSFIVPLFGEKLLIAVVMGMASGGTPLGLTMVLASFLPLAIAPLLVTRLLHRRPVASLFGPGAWRDFLRVFPALLLLVLMLWPLSFLDPHLGQSTPVAVLIQWLPIALPLLFVQIASEELVFRGYLLQQLASRSPNPLWWMVLPAALFGSLHFAPEQNGAAAIFLALWAMGFGCLSADLTARAGNLGPSLAFHFANNISAMFLVGLYGQLDGLALYTLVIDTSDLGAMLPYLAADSLAMVVFWLIARLRLRR